MRGKEHLRHSCRNWSRITPAYAGKSSSAFDCPDRCGDHPRLCGEKQRDAHAVGLDIGSPPPMRGKGSGEPLEESRMGITPAYAGKSLHKPDSQRWKWDHPRLCGEKTQWEFLYLFWGGSPPPMRGKADMGNKCRPYLGITPAYAGKRSLAIAKKKRERDHPRLCGEKRVPV